MIRLNSPEDIEGISKAAKILAKAAETLKNSVEVGVTTLDLDRLAEKEFDKLGVVSAFKGYRGFPASICASLNQEVVHGIPGERSLKAGDIISIDIGIEKDGYYADMAFTQAVGKIDAKSKKLIEITRQALSKGIEQAKVNNRISDISRAIQLHVEKFGFSVVREYVGHGIGKQLHEEPQIPNFGRAYKGELIKEGMVFAIEPMVNIGTWQVEILDDGWTAVTKDRRPSAHFEHTIVVLKDGPKVLTIL